MIDTNRLEVIIAEFAKKYNFLQWKNISNLFIKSKPMFTKKQLQLDGKSYVQIECIAKSNDYILYIGKIYFTLESSKKEEIYSVDTGDNFTINLSDFSDEETLIETMIEKCKEYNHL
jgi:hypothetical protein